VKPSTVLVKHALTIGAIELLSEGRQLKSGRISPYFFNSGLFTSDTSLNLLGTVLAETFKQHWEMLEQPTVIFGPAYKGICLSALAVSELGRDAQKEWHQMQHAHDRKEAKQHGEGGQIVGASLKGKRVVIVDDVITTGGTKDEAVELITENGGTVTGLIVLFDRQERSNEGELSAAQEFSKKHAVPVIAVANLSKLTEYIKSHAAGSDETHRLLEAIMAYRCLYGAR
jgi:orotate phosphoribosyltransferase